MSNEVKNTIICSTQDRASQNIKNNLLALRKWELVPDNKYSIFEFRDFRIFELDEPLIYQDGLDKKLDSLGFPCSLLIFASKHRSKDGRAILTVHSTGNAGEARFGGRSKELAMAAPQAVRSLLRGLRILAGNDDYEVTLECTHHGPSDIHVPSVFIEIGSNEEQWLDEAAGRIVANAILMTKEHDSPVAIGFGGTHYAPRQTSLVLETDITFGHIFPNHVLSELDRDIIRQAFLTSGADFAYFDRKSMKAHERERLGSIIAGLGFEVLKESDIRDMDGISWNFCMQLRQKAKEICPGGRAMITDGIKCQLGSCQVCPRVKLARINPALLSEAEKFDRERLRKFLSDNNIAYIEYEDGRFAHVIIALDSSCARLVAEDLTKECVDILKEHCNIVINNGTLQITEKKFSAQRAKSLGIEEGPMYGKLAQGESIVIDGKTINPEMVYETNKKIIRLIEG